MKQSHSSVQQRAIKIMQVLRGATEGMPKSASTLIIERYGKDPYLILISCVLSLRTKDTTTYPASCRLFEKAKTPQEMLTLRASTIENLIYPVGFYRTKAKSIHAISKELIDRFDSKVPDRKDDLISLPGVGLKTANLVLGEAFDQPAICVDTHVHRVSNRLGLVKTKSPDQTEHALKELLPEKYWTEFGQLILLWGQNICVPMSPFCSQCAIADMCPQIGVKRSR